MSSTSYKEEQPVRESILPLILIPSWLLVVGIFSWGFYTQLVKGKPWGDDPTSNTTLLVTGILVIVLLGAFYAVTIAGRFIMEVRSDGFYYCFTPYINKLRHIPTEKIGSISVEKLNTFNRISRKGFHINAFSRTTSINLNSKYAVSIRLMNGKHYVFGTNKPEQMEAALKRMMENRTSRYT